MAELRLSTWGIKNPIPVALLFLAAVMAGAISYTFLPIKQFPNVVFPAVLVIVTDNGAAPQEIKTQITRPIEDAMAGIAGVRDMQSQIAEGSSTTEVEFELGEDLQKVTDEVRQRVDQTRVNLPREIDPPTVQRIEIDSQPILTYAVASPDMSDSQLSWFVDDTISRSLQSAKGVAQVSRVGGVDREINVLIDPDRMAAQGLTATQLNGALAAFNANIPGGRVDVGGREQTVRVLGEALTVARLRDLTIPTAGGRFVKLSDVADVGDGASEPRGFARLNDRPVVGFQVLKTNDASEVVTEDNVKQAIVKLKQQYPSVSFTEVFSTVDNTRATYEATLRTMFEGMALAALVVFLFLRDWRSTAIVAVAMPVSLIPTFLAMAVLGFSLNIVTLLALTLVIGILVDDAIVEIENIQKRVQAGARPYRASMEGADQIGLAVIATTAAIVVVFAPVSFMGSIPGQFFKEFGFTVVISVLFSLLVARLLTPLLAAYFLKPSAVPRPRGDLRPFYRRSLDWALSHRWIMTGVGAIVVVLTLAILGVGLPTGVQPPANPDYMFVGIQGPPGATLADMQRIETETTALIKAHVPEASEIFVQVGSVAGEGFGGGGAGAGLSSGTVTVVLRGDRQRTVNQISDALRPYLRDIPDARVSIQGGGFGAASVQIVLTSDDSVALQRTGEELQREMRTLRNLADPRPALPPIGPEIAIRPKPDQASRLGVTVESIATIARVATLGDIDANVPKLTDGERRVPIRVRLPANARTDIDMIRALQIPTASGATTPLSSVADVDFQAGPAVIERYGRRDELAIDADLTNGAQIGQGLAEVNHLPIMRHLPPGVEPATLGQQQEYVDLFSALFLAFVTGVSLIYGVLVLLFRSFFKPVIIIGALPLALFGAAFALFVTRESLSIPSLIGVLMLLGIAAKNSILLVEYAIERERDGMPQRQAIMEACRERARPIIMTSLAMIAGMLPTAFALGKGSEFRQPMAIAVIGGLITSTVLSLLMVPVIYEVLDDIEHWLVPKLGRLITPREAPPPPPEHGVPEREPIGAVARPPISVAE
ncbi:MAG TPA: efflux RND transporter permease subunit [Caulobacteraceae bacterium]|nr:efflux RND transporter permease subunit [Caulobacteraceae bacterium]